MDQLLTQKILWGILLIFFGFWTIQTIKYILGIRKIAKKHIEKVNKLEAQKCTGPHRWVNMFVIDDKKHVCQDCCWCPDLEDYIKRPFVNAELKAIEFRKGLEHYTEIKMIDICEEFDIPIDDLNKIKEKIYSIKKDYAVDFISKNLKDSEKMQ